jgi:hypothetical protein
VNAAPVRAAGCGGTGTFVFHFGRGRFGHGRGQSPDMAQRAMSAKDVAA